MIVVFLACAPECLVPKSCCLSCPHLDLVTFEVTSPSLFDLMLVCYYLALCISICSNLAVWLVPFSHALDFLINALHRLCFFHILQLVTTPWPCLFFGMFDNLFACISGWLILFVVLWCWIFLSCIIIAFQFRSLPCLLVPPCCGLFMLPTRLLLFHHIFCWSLNNILEVYKLLFSRIQLVWKLCQLS